MSWKGKHILITGGTGSLGRVLVSKILAEHPDIRLLTVFSRDEFKQHQLRRDLPAKGYPGLRFVLGDVRDREAVSAAISGVDVVIHAAALKQNPTGESFPDEFFKTNVDGTRHLIYAAATAGVGHLLMLSTDKAVYPLSAYGASKLCAEKLMIAAQDRYPDTRFTVFRLGNLLGSRASVVGALQADERGKVRITHPGMTRFSLQLSESARLCLEVLTMMRGGEIFVPHMHAYRLGDLVSALFPDQEKVSEGPRRAEKMHEAALCQEEVRYGFSYRNYCVICPAKDAYSRWEKTAHTLPQDFTYRSDEHQRLLSAEALAKLLQSIKSG